MTTSDTQAPVVSLKQAINHHLNELVRQATRTAALLQQPQHARMEESQLRNLMNVAAETGSIEVVINFIRYQIARNDRAWGSKPHDFGHTLIDDLRTGVVKTIADKVSQYETQPGEAYAQLMRLYLGYVTRAFYYGKKTGKWEQLSEVANA
jgi:hypothetical protein